jgi:hypothetical protein
MKVKLANIELPAVQEIAVYDHRSLAEQKPPGMHGSLFQNLGRFPTGIMVWGIATGPKTLTFLEKLDQLFRAAKPATFVTDMIAGAGVSQIVIEDLRIEDVAGKPGRSAYALSLREFIKPSKATDHTALNAGIKAQAQHRVHQLTSRLTRARQVH